MRLRFRKVCNSKTFASWVRSLSKSSGVYLIRALDGEMLYIGESHTKRLYKTLTRHFQKWSDYRRYRIVYDRNSVRVAVVQTPDEIAFEKQNVLIARFKPRDNIIINDQT